MLIRTGFFFKFVLAPQQKMVRFAFLSSPAMFTPAQLDANHVPLQGRGRCEVHPTPSGQQRSKLSLCP